MKDFLFYGSCCVILILFIVTEISPCKHVQQQRRTNKDIQLTIDSINADIDTTLKNLREIQSILNDSKTTQ